MNLQVNPQIALCDQNFNITISELHPFAKVKISASMFYPWAKSVLFESFAWFSANYDGTVDLSKQKPESGCYDYIDSMGLIKSLKSKDKKALGKIGKNVSINGSLFINITAQCENETAEIKVERLFLAEGVKRQKITDEFVGELFYSENRTNKTVVFLGGSGSGNLDLLSLFGAPLASHGFNVLTVAYFGEKGLPPNLSEIPLEYFEKVFTWLSENQTTTGKEIYLFCISKGAELGLILASRFHFITKVVAFAPHAYCFQGIAFKNVSSWTYERKSLPFIRLKNRWFPGYVLKCFFKNQPFGFTYLFKRGLKVAGNKETARIKIENSKCDFLFVTSLQCNMWNTYDGCVVLMETLQKYNYQYKFDLITYEDAGEPYAPAYLIPYGDGRFEIFPRLVLSTGGTAEGNAFAQEDSWRKAIEFLKN